MSILLFASNRHYPQCGVLDMVGCYTELTDKVIFDAIVARIKSKHLEKDDSLEVNSLDISNGVAGAEAFWEFRIEKTLDHENLEFASLKENLAEFGACGLVPLTRVKRPPTGDPFYDWDYHHTLDEQKRIIW